MNINEIVDAILNGEYDEHHQYIFDALNIRDKALRKQRELRAIREIKVGDTVRLVGVSPKRAEGMHVKVTSIDPIRVDYNGRTGAWPASCYEKVG